jgi:hypothetical protein
LGISWLALAVPSAEDEEEGREEGRDEIFVGCGAGGIGTMMALSREGGARQGREESVCVVARRREVQRQW